MSRDAEPYVYWAQVHNVVDGDTFDAEVDLGFYTYMKLRFRVEGVDTPEIHFASGEDEREHGEKATAMAEDLLLNNWVKIISQGLGLYGRWEAIVYLEDGRRFDEVMIEAGMRKKASYE